MTWFAPDAGNTASVGKGRLAHRNACRQNALIAVAQTAKNLSCRQMKITKIKCNGRQTVSEYKPLDDDAVQNLAQDAMERRPWPHVDDILFPDLAATRQDAKELANEEFKAMSEYTPEYLEREASLLCSEAEQPTVQDMLRDGAKAMRELAEFKSGVIWQQALSRLNENAKLEARVKVLESALWKIHNSAHCHALLKIEAAAALQVKP